MSKHCILMQIVWIFLKNKNLFGRPMAQLAKLAVWVTSKTAILDFAFMHLSFVSTTPGRAGIPGGFDNKFVPERRAFDK